MATAAVILDHTDTLPPAPPAEVDHRPRAVRLAEAREHAHALPLEDIDVTRKGLFLNDVHWPYFERLRDEAPVHYNRHFEWGPYWSITRYADIMAIDTDHKRFSSDAHKGGIVVRDFDADFIMPMFIAMDPPKHDIQRKAVQPIVAPAMLAHLEGLIRERAQDIFNNLPPKGETFDWVDRVSIELTTQMLATLFDFPWEDRRKLTRWSDVATAEEGGPITPTREARQEELLECLQYFTRLWQERAAAPPRNDLISIMAHDPATRDMPPMEFLGNLVLLIVGGNDTTRNSISGGVYAMQEHPEYWDRLRADPKLIESMVPEIIRWQTPLAHMRRTALEDVEMHGQRIREGDRVVMWYVSGNRDPRAIDRPDAFIIDRPRPRQHLSFGFGIHRCVGNRLGEMQLRIVWEEILKRYDRIEVMAEPARVPSAFVKGYMTMPVRLH